MADDRIQRPNLPYVPERYDRENETAFRREVATLYAEVDAALSRQAGTFSAKTLEDISDVDAYSSLAAGEVLKWSGTGWVHNTLAEANIPGLSLANTWTAAGGNLAETGTSGNRAWATRVTGDSTDRVQLRMDGYVLWSAGSGAQDTNLYRNAANQLKTDDSLVVGGSLTLINSADLLVNDGSVQITSPDGTTCAFIASAYGTFPRLTARGANGTEASPTATTNFNVLFRLYAAGYYSGFQEKTIMEVAAGENWSGSAQGMNVNFNTVVDGATSTTRFMRFDSNSPGTVCVAATSSLKLTFFSSSGGSTKKTVTGSRGGNAALASLLTALASYGLITNSTT